MNSRLFLSFFAVLAPLKPLVLATLVLILFDLITGVWRAIKQGEPVTSQGLRRTITKIIAYNMALLTSWILEVYFLEGLFPATKIVAALIALTESKSILENLSLITGLDFWKAIKRKMDLDEKDPFTKKIVPPSEKALKKKSPTE